MKIRRRGVEKSPALVRHLPRNIDFVIPVAETDCARQVYFILLSGEGAVKSAGGKNDHVFRIREQRYQPGDVKAIVSRPEIGCHETERKDDAKKSGTL